MHCQAPEQRPPLPLPSPCPTVKAHTLPLLQGGEPGLEETEATSSIWQGSDSSSPQAPKTESYFSFQLLRGEAQSSVRGCLAAEGLQQNPSPLPHPARHCQAVILGLSCLWDTISPRGPSCESGPPSSPLYYSNEVPGAFKPVPVSEALSQGEQKFPRGQRRETRC